MAEIKFGTDPSADDVIDGQGNTLSLSSAPITDLVLNAFDADSAIVAGLTFTALTYDKNYQWEVININRNQSVCEVKIVDVAKTQLSDFGSPVQSLGFIYDKTTVARHHLIVIEATQLGQGVAYGKDKIVLFSGYLEEGVRLNLRDDSITATYTGIENLANELQVTGILTYDFSDSVSGDKIVFNQKFIKFNSGMKCVFNEGGQPDMYDHSDDLNKETPEDGFQKHRLFNKTGNGPVRTWTVGDIIAYLQDGYTKIFPKILLLTDTETANVNNLFIGIDFETARFKDNEGSPASDTQDRFFSYIPEELFNVKVDNFSLEGLGFKDAYVKTLRESKTFALSIQYNQEGQAILGITSTDTIPSDVSSSPTTTTRRLTTDQPIKINRGGSSGSYDATNVMETDSSLSINREMYNVGRVVVLGKNTTINTLISNVHDGPETASVNFEFSSTLGQDNTLFTALTGSPAGHIKDFTKNLDMYITNIDTDNELAPRTYKITSKNFVKSKFKLEDILPSPLPADLLTDYDTRLFQSTRMVKAKKKLESSWKEKGKRDKDVTFLIGVMGETGSPSQKFAQIQNPIGLTILSLSAIAGENGGVIMLPKDLVEVQRTENLNTELTADLLSYKGKYFKAAQQKMYPLFLRMNIETDHQLKGIATIPGFTDATHRTIFFYDDKFQLHFDFKDAFFQNDRLTPIADGFILNEDGSDPGIPDVIAGIKKVAEQLLDKYVTKPQNSGSTPLSGWQLGFKIGDYIQEISGNAVGSPTFERKFNFPAIISSVTYSRLARTTELQFSTIDD